MEERLQARFRLRQTDAGFHSSEDVHPSAAPILHVVELGKLRADLGLHHDGDANLRGRSGIGAVKSGLADADDGERISIHQQFLADDVGPAAETAQPVAIADDRDGMAARDLIVIRREDSAERGSDAEHREIAARDEFALHALGFSLRTDAERCVPAAEHSAEDLVVIADVLVHRVGDSCSCHCCCRSADRGPRA